MDKRQIKLPAEVEAKYDLVKPIKQLIVQTPQKRKIAIESCSLEEAAVLCEKGYLKEKAKSPAKDK